MSNVEFLLTSFQNSSIDDTAVDTLMCSMINDYVLKVNDDTYDFCEIELYYKSPTHNDCSVLKRKKEAGDIFFHRYGMDICFNSNGTDKYGGILIRSLKKDDDYIFGPLTCAHTILNDHQPTIRISIQEKRPKNQEKACKTTRVKATCEKDKNYNQALYRYVTKDACTAIQNDNKYSKKVQEKICNGEKKENNE